MRLLAAALLLISAFVKADCPNSARTTIVFGNGIGTSLDEAQNTRDHVLAPAILQAPVAAADGSCITFALAYDSTFVDSTNNIITTANFLAQLADAAVQEGIDFAANFWNYTDFVVTPPAWFVDLQRQLITSATSIYQPDLVNHEVFYNSELGLGHHIIVVAHSQGNLYVNQAYDVVTSLGGANLFQIVAVATPAHSVAGGGPHFTLFGDVITVVPESLLPNISNDPPSPCSAPLGFIACHDFDNSYMAGDVTRPAIVQAVVESLPPIQATWTQKFPVNSPLGPRIYAPLAADVTNQRVILFGGIFANPVGFNDTWAWDGSNWTQNFPASIPTGRYAHSMVYDSARAQIVMFGGVENYNGSQTLGDTWAWDGSNWAQKFPATSPPPRSHHCMAFDSERGQTVLFGGFSSSFQVLNDTWVWNGANWSQKHPTNSPPPRACFGNLAYDAAHGQTVLFGGQTSGASFQTIGDTWAWDGSNWTQKFPATSPLPRALHSMGFDAGAGKTIMLGGVGQAGTNFQDTWAWDGSNWALITPSAAVGCCDNGMTFDFTRNQMVLWNTNSTWVWPQP